MIRIGVDLAKNYFQIHALETEGGPCVRRKLKMREFLFADRALQRGDGGVWFGHYRVRAGTDAPAPTRQDGPARIVAMGRKELP